MKFLPVSAALFASLLTLVAAKDEIRLPNSFIVPAPGEVLKAGTEYTVRWIADTKGKVKLVLRKGPSTDLDTLGLIAEVENKGSYLWAIDEDLESGTDYALQIIDSSNDDEFNYTSQFTIQSDVPASDEDEEDDKPTSASGSGSATVSRTATADDDSSTTLATVTRSGTSTATESSTASATDDETDAEETDPAEEVEESDGAAGALAVKGLSLVAGVMMVAFFA